jgi:hypothetical protein
VLDREPYAMRGATLPAVGEPYALGSAALGSAALGGAALGGTALGGTALGGTALGGTALGSAALGGAALGGTALGGTALGGTASVAGSDAERVSPVGDCAPTETYVVRDIDDASGLDAA